MSGRLQLWLDLPYVSREEDPTVSCITNGVRFVPNKRIVMKILSVCFLVFICGFVYCSTDEGIPKDSYKVYCTNLRLGQYLCPDPDYDIIDPQTQQPRGCSKENKAKVDCKAADGIFCLETNSTSFKKDIHCKWTNGYSFETALLLSVFLGMFGIDRFYLGYPAIGLLKFCTLGFMFLGQLIDVILIATQVVGPADGSHYVIPYYGAGISIMKSDNTTFKLPQTDW